MTLTVRLSPEFLTKVSELIDRIGVAEIKSGTEILGPLFGTREDGLLIARTFRIVPVHDLRMRRPEYFAGAFERLLTVSRSELNSFELIGWCCIRSGDTKGLLDSDAVFHSRRFPGIGDIALFVRPDEATALFVEAYASSPNGGVSNTECYSGAASFLTDGSPTGSLEFPLKLRSELLAPGASPSLPARPLDHPEAEQSRLEAALAQIPESPPETGLSLFTSFRTNRLYWTLGAVVSGIAAGAMFLGLLHANSSTPVTKPPPSVSAALAPPSPGVDMRVEAQQGDRLLVKWNRDSPIIGAAKYGTLYIDDGPQHKEIVFAPGEMRSGSILYRPASDDVSFRLQVLGRDDSMSTETVRVLDGAMAAAMNANAAKPQVPIPDVAPSSTGESVEARNRRLEALVTVLQARAQHSAALSDHRLEPLKEGKSNPVLTRPKKLDLQNEIPEHKRLSDAHLEASTQSLLKPALSVAPPPKLSITTSPQAASMDLHTLPQAPPAAPAPSATPVNATSIAAYLPPRPLKQVLPDITGLGNAIYGRKRVDVHVDIDTGGRVKVAKLIKPGTDIPEALRDSVLQAARQWVFTPATMHGKPVSSDHTIVFDFRPRAQ